MSVVGEWMDDAACRAHDPRWWHPTPPSNPDRPGHTRRSREMQEMERKAKAICKGCPVQVPCLRHALARPEGDGIWGGMTSRERQELSRKEQHA